MAKIVKKGNARYWVDGEGVETPEKYIDPRIKERDAFVSRLVEKARQMNLVLTNFKRQMETEIADFLQESAQREGEEWVGGTTLWNFSMDESVVIKVARRWTFDENLQLAKQKIDRVIENRSEGSDDLIVALVNRAFKVDTRGEVDAKQMWGLRQLKVEDDLWNEAMDLIADAQKVQSTKTYFYFQQAGPDGKMESILLDFASI
jgi:hypothetical protein